MARICTEMIFYGVAFITHHVIALRVSCFHKFNELFSQLNGAFKDDSGDMGGDSHPFERGVAVGAAHGICGDRLAGHVTAVFRVTCALGSALEYSRQHGVEARVLN